MLVGGFYVIMQQRKFLCHYHKQVELVGNYEVQVGRMFQTKEILGRMFLKPRHSEASTGVLIHLTSRRNCFIR